MSDLVAVRIVKSGVRGYCLNEVAGFSEDEANRLVEKGFAELVKTRAKAEAEKAEAEGSETEEATPSPGKETRRRGSRRGASG